MSAWGWVWRVGGVLVLLLFLVVAGLMFYASTPHFLNLVSRRVVTVLEDATGGRVELESLHWSLRHLAVEVDGLTIHGLEGRGEAPYAQIDRIYARAKILGLVLNKVKIHSPDYHYYYHQDYYSFDGGNPRDDEEPV